MLNIDSNDFKNLRSMTPPEGLNINLRRSTSNSFRNNEISYINNNEIEEEKSTNELHHSRSMPNVGDVYLKRYQQKSPKNRSNVVDNKLNESEEFQKVDISHQRSLSGSNSAKLRILNSKSKKMNLDRFSKLNFNLKKEVSASCKIGIQNSSSPEFKNSVSETCTDITHAKYYDFAQKGANLFRICTSNSNRKKNYNVNDNSFSPNRSSDSDCDANISSTPFCSGNKGSAPVRGSRLQTTPSMIMLDEAAAVLSESPSALIPMDEMSTGGVYQLRRQKSYYGAQGDLQLVQSLKTVDHAIKNTKLEEENKTNKNIEKYDNNRFNFKNRGRPRFFNSKLNKKNKDAMAKTGSSLLNKSLKYGIGKSVTFSHEEPSSAKSESISIFRNNSSSSIDDTILRRVKSYDENTEKESEIREEESILNNNENNSDSHQNFSKINENKEPRLRRKYASKVAVFKPEDEETGANHSSGIGTHNPERAGMLIGGGARRERAAYLLDKNVNRFSHVPETALVYSNLVPINSKTTIKNNESKKLDIKNNDNYVRKRGSLQRFQESDGNADDRPDLVRLASASQVHAIGILDLRVFNTDRHGGNILCRKDKDDNIVRLIPIDHGLTLPVWFYLGEAFFDWVFWPQAQEPFSQESLNLIESIDIKKDEAVLKGLDISPGAIATNKICTIALKTGAKNDLNLKDLGTMFQRPFTPGHNLHNKYFSPLEHIIMETCQVEKNMEYCPSGSQPIDKYSLLQATDNQHKKSMDEIDIGLLEKQAFSDQIPNENFYISFQQILERRIRDDSWRSFLKIT